VTARASQGRTPLLGLQDIVARRYSLQRPAFGAVLECIEVLRGTSQALPAACAMLALDG
jgi:hypothetical protein